MLLLVSAIALSTMITVLFVRRSRGLNDLGWLSQGWIAEQRATSVERH